MLANCPACEDRILKHEGGYTDGVHPYDPGGCTNLGVTIADGRKYWKPNATCADMKVLPRSEAIVIVRDRYWVPLRCDDLPSGLDDTVSDYGYNSGIGRPGKVLRRLCGLPDNTSKIDDIVLAAVAKRDVKALIHGMNAERLKFLQGLAIWPTYKNGWTTRVREVEAFSIELANKPGTLPSTPISPVDTGKGVIPPPTTATTVAKGGGGAAAASGAWFTDWIFAHQIEAVLIGAAIVGLVVLAIYLIKENHRAAQEAPTPGLVPVPETKP